MFHIHDMGLTLFCTNLHYQPVPAVSTVLEHNCCLACTPRLPQLAFALI